MTRTDLDDAAALPPVTFTPEQAAAIVMALATRPDGPYAADGRAALEKVLDALDPEHRERAARLAERVRAGSRAPSAAGVHRAVAAALAQHRVLVLDYRDRAGRVTRRRVEPQAVVRTGDHWHLVAWCLERAEIRWFRYGRIRDAEVTSDPATDRGPVPVGSPAPGSERARPRHSAAHPAGRARPAGPRAHGPGVRAGERLAPVVHLRSVR